MPAATFSERGIMQFLENGGGPILAFVPSAITSALTPIGRRGKKAAEDGLSRVSDTKEFAHVDDRPIILTVWSNGKFGDHRTLDHRLQRYRLASGSKPAKRRAWGSGEGEASSQGGTAAKEADYQKVA